MIAEPVLPDSYEKKLDSIKAQYPDPRSAIMSALYLAQEHFGLINEEAVQWVAGRLGIAAVHVMEVATFYTMYYKAPVGRYHIQVCRTLSCQLRGSRKIVDLLQRRLRIKAGEVSSDGMWSFEEVECLGSCGSAPVCEVNDTYFENLSEEKLSEIIEAIEKSKPDLRFSTLQDALGNGMAGHAKREIV